MCPPMVRTPWTRDVIARFRVAIGDASADVRLCFSGTGANMLGAGLAGYPRLIVAEQSHIALDEEGGPLYLLGGDANDRAGGAGRLPGSGCCC